MVEGQALVDIGATTGGKLMDFLKQDHFYN